jgi:putative SOS response-associated peptidase YedK
MGERSGQRKQNDQRTRRNAGGEAVVQAPAQRPPLSRSFGRFLRVAEGRRKVPMRFKLKSGDPFTFGGLWDAWKQPDGRVLRTYTIITTDSNNLIQRIHNRMPVMLHHDDALKWLAGDAEIAHSLSLLKPYLGDFTERTHPISTKGPT